MLGFDALGKNPLGYAGQQVIAGSRTASASIAEANDTVTSAVAMVRPKGRGRPRTANTWLLRRQKTKRTPLFYRDASIGAASSPNPTAWADWFFPREQIPATATITEADDTVSSAATISGSGAVSATASITEAGDTLESAATLALRAEASITEDIDTLTAAAQIPILANATITEADDTLAAVVELNTGNIADASIAEDNDTVVCLGIVFGYPAGFKITNISGAARLSTTISGAPKLSTRIAGSTRLNVRTGSR